MRRCAIVLCAGVLVLPACGGDDDASTTGSPSESAAESESSDVTTTTVPESAAESVSGPIDIGDGTELYVDCRGEGSPTILLEAGDEDDVFAWGQVMPQLGEQTHTCAYDRRGIGRSDEATGCRGLDELLGDTEAMLAAADIPGPYVLVGASGGGFLMAGYAARHPDDVAGLVLVETPKALTIIPEGVAEEISCDNPDNREHRDYYAVEHAVWDNRAPVGEFPMTIISNDYGPDAPPTDDATNVADQQGWLTLSPNSKQVVVTSGHDVASDEPTLVVDEILEVLEAARAADPGASDR